MFDKNVSNRENICVPEVSAAPGHDTDASIYHHEWRHSVYQQGPKDGEIAQKAST